MSARPMDSPEKGPPNLRFEENLRRAAAVFPYPETPDLAARERQRLERGPSSRSLAQRHPVLLGLALVVIVLLAALLVSPVRARVLDWFRIGAVQIFFTEPSPTPTAQLPAGRPTLAMTLTPQPTPTFLKSVLDLSGETSLSKAQEQLGFPIQLPAYPPDLGLPEHVYLQSLNAQTLVLVWMDKNQPGQVRMSLSESSSERPVFQKYDPKSILNTEIDGHEAVWMDGEYVVVMRNGDVTLTRLMTQSHTLIWTNGKMTYRLETDVDLETAQQIARSIR